jgi:hypothetical protein
LACGLIVMLFEGCHGRGRQLQRPAERQPRLKVLAVGLIAMGTVGRAAPGVVKQRTQSDRMQHVGTQVQFAREHHRQQADIEGVLIDRFAADPVAHQVDGDIGIQQHRAGHGVDQAQGIPARSVCLGRQVLAYRAGHAGVLHQGALALGHLDPVCGKAICRGALAGRVWRWCGACRGSGRLACRFRVTRPGRGIAALWRAAHLLQAQRAQRGQLLLVFDLETGECKRMLGPRKVQMNIHAHANLRGAEVLVRLGVGPTEHGDGVQVALKEVPPWFRRIGRDAELYLWK